MTWKPVLLTMTTSLLVDLFVRSRLPTNSWGFFTAPPEPILQKFAGVKKLWVSDMPKYHDLG